MKSYEEVGRDLLAMMALPTENEKIDAMERYLKNLRERLSDEEFATANRYIGAYLHNSVTAPFQAALMKSGIFPKSQ